MSFHCEVHFVSNKNQAERMARKYMPSALKWNGLSAYGEDERGKRRLVKLSKGYAIRGYIMKEKSYEVRRQEMGDTVYKNVLEIPFEWPIAHIIVI